ncbi:hypothetical protein [Actinomadura rudentiformis]|uniref:hypothetical protein n=1 Tax=Actinomadura rudentiformis TaxID=359158 RepID=UPI00178C5A68|nr:hypothetical protein [Actinomadura rudentiformis]
MAKDRDQDRRPRKCGACNGEGGYYAEVNGKTEDDQRVQRKWVKCPACNGEGMV